MFEDYSKYPKHYYKYLPFNKYTISSRIHSEFWFCDALRHHNPYIAQTYLDRLRSEEIDMTNVFIIT
jgi:hypothetical protein